MACVASAKDGEVGACWSEAELENCCCMRERWCMFIAGDSITTGDIFEEDYLGIRLKRNFEYETRLV